MTNYILQLFCYGCETWPIESGALMKGVRGQGFYLSIWAYEGGGSERLEENYLLVSWIILFYLKILWQ